MDNHLYLTGAIHLAVAGRHGEPHHRCGSTSLTSSATVEEVYRNLPDVEMLPGKRGPHE